MGLCVGKGERDGGMGERESFEFCALVGIMNVFSAGLKTDWFTLGILIRSALYSVMKYSIYDLAY